MKVRRVFAPRMRKSGTRGDVASGTGGGPPRISALRAEIPGPPLRRGTWFPAAQSFDAMGNYLPLFAGEVARRVEGGGPLRVCWRWMECACGTRGWMVWGLWASRQWNWTGGRGWCIQSAAFGPWPAGDHRHAGVVKLVDAPDSKSATSPRAGSGKRLRIKALRSTSRPPPNQKARKPDAGLTASRARHFRVRRPHQRPTRIGGIGRRSRLKIDRPRSSRFESEIRDAGVGGPMPQEAVHLFLAFVRFEAALKNGGYLKGGPGDAASPAWDDFADDLGLAFFQSQAASAQAAIFFNAPPRKQIVGDDGGLAWQEMEVPPTSKELLRAVRRVRNNLHHGAKLIPTQRDHDLIVAATRVLDAARAHAEMDANLQPVAQALPNPIWA
jgi:hypothetical protein